MGYTCRTRCHEYSRTEIDSGWVLGASGAVTVEVILVKNNGNVGISNVDVLRCDIVRSRRANLGLKRAPVCVISASALLRNIIISYLAVQDSNILDPDVLNDILDARVLSNTSYTHAVDVIVPRVLHENIGM